MFIKQSWNALSNIHKNMLQSPCYRKKEQSLNQHDWTALKSIRVSLQSIRISLKSIRISLISISSSSIEHESISSSLESYIFVNCKPCQKSTKGTNRRMDFNNSYRELKSMPYLMDWRKYFLLRQLNQCTTPANLQMQNDLD